MTPTPHTPPAFAALTLEQAPGSPVEFFSVPGGYGYRIGALAGSTTDPTPLTGGHPGLQLYEAGFTAFSAVDTWTDLVTQAGAIATLRRAISLVGGVRRQLTSSELGTGIKPLVLLGGILKLRATTEGTPVVFVGGKYKTLSANETLEI